MKRLPESVARAVIATTMLCWLPQQASAGGGAMGGATEMTQVLNHAELAATVAKQAQMVSEQIAARMVQIQQYETMVRNLKDVGPNLINQALAPYQTQLGALQSLGGSVNALKQTSLNAQQVINGRISEAASMNMDLRTYLSNEMALASRRGGVHRQRVDQDLAAIDDLAAKASNLRTVASQTQDVTGNVQGLQQLARLSSISAGELLEIKAALLSQNVNQNEDAARRAQAEAQRASAAAQAVGETTLRRERNSGTTFRMTTPWGEGAE